MIIGLCGYSNSGKSTVAKFLVKEKGFVELSFAKKLKDTVSHLFGYERELLEGTTLESRIWRETKDIKWSKSFNREITPRILLQEIGTKIREFQDDFWIRILEDSINLLRSQNKNVNIVITDARFLNEIAFIKSFSGIMYWVIRDIPEYHNEIITAIKNNGIPNIKIHRSEWEFLMEPMSTVIRNSGDLKDLFSTLNLIF